MRRIWAVINGHRLSAAVFLLAWLAAYGLHVFRYGAPRNTPDLVHPVLELHLLLPAAAGALVYWWRRSKPDRIMSGMLAGAAILVVDAVLVVAYQAIVFGLGGPGGNRERGTEIPTFLSALALTGSLLGLIGLSIAAAGESILSRWRKAARGSASFAEDRGVVPRGILLLAGGLTWGAAAIVALVVIPGLRTSLAGGIPERAIHAFVAGMMLNMLAGIALVVPLPRRTRAGEPLVLIAGFLCLLLGSVLLDAGSVFMARDRGVAAGCFAGAAGDLVAGFLALITAFRRYARAGGPRPAV